jgi:hypothetical protein
MWEGPLLELDVRLWLQERSRRMQRSRFLHEPAPSSGQSWRSCLARDLVSLGVWLDPQAAAGVPRAQPLRR